MNRNHNERLCFFVDAFETHWASITNYVPIQDIHLPHNGQRHEPLSFLSGMFTETQWRWCTLEKESYSVIATIERMHWLASCHEGFYLFTDHNDLVFISDPIYTVQDLSQASIRKVILRELRPSIYSYQYIHLSVVDNVWADIL